jgi:subtilisin family serine protease
MASPHVAGVAALIRQLHPNMPSGTVAAWLRLTATPLACPKNWPSEDPRRCTGGIGQTNFHGAGMVNALKATR